MTIVHSIHLQINIDPESLKPKLPSRKDLRPYPTKTYLEYRGHRGPVTSITTDSSGQWIASGTDSIYRTLSASLFVKIEILVFRGNKMSCLGITYLAVY